jgi:hypothetical protein
MRAEMDFVDKIWSAGYPAPLQEDGPYGTPLVCCTPECGRSRRAAARDFYCMQIIPTVACRVALSVPPIAGNVVT